MGSLGGRRRFLAQAGLAALGAPSLRKVLGANERLHLGLIGAGKRGFTLLNRLRTQKAVPLVFTAVCDVYPPHLERARKATGEAAEAYVDHRKLLEQKDLSAVVIATPEHHHRNHLLNALAAGKHVYLETPLSHSIDETREAVAAVARSGLIVQVGLQERSGPHFLSAKKEIIDKGSLGTITQIEAWWRIRISQPAAPPPKGLNWDLFLGPARVPAPSPEHFWRWRFFWAFSGGFMAEPGHHICDLMNWFGALPVPQLVSMGGGAYARKQWEVPDTFVALWRYPTLVATFSVSAVSSFNDWHDHGICFRGTEGSLEISRKGWRFYSEAEKRVIKELGPSDLDGAHLENFLLCVRAGDSKKLAAPVTEVFSGMCAAHAANRAYRECKAFGVKENWALEVLK